MKMKQKLFTLVAAMLMAATTANAKVLYGKVEGSTLTLMCGDATPSGHEGIQQQQYFQLARRNLFL